MGSKPLTVEQINRYTYMKKAVAEYPLSVGGAGQVGHHRVFVRDIEFYDIDDITKAVGTPVDLVYVDLPWGGGVTSQFRKRAGMQKGSYGEFRIQFCKLLAQLHAKHIVLEMGNSWVEKWKEVLAEHGLKVTHTVQGTYYRRDPMTYMLIGPKAAMLADSLRGVDDMDSPGVVIQQLPDVRHVVDLCCGRGTTAYWAEKFGRRFTGVELDPDRASGALFHVDMLMKEKADG